MLVNHIDALRAAIRAVKQSHPFEIHAWVVLPDHMHCVIELPQDDSDFATRWRLIKARFSKSIPPKNHARSFEYAVANEVFGNGVIGNT